MHVVFRVDASNQIGSGHAMRCLTLAQELAKKGAKCHFICAELSGNMIGYLGSKGFSVHKIPCPELAEDISVSKKSDHLQLLRNKKLSDAGETIKIVETIFTEKDKVDLIVVDHYSLDCDWEQLLRPYVGRITVIDDTADRPHDCDILLDQNLYENMEARYEGLVPEHCIKLLGPQYALLRPEFREARKTLRRRDGTVKRILVFMGGADPTNETAKALEAIKLLNKPELIVDVVVGCANPNRVEIEAICNKMANTNFYCQVENMAELMVKADLAIGGGGSNTWERCCVGLPAVTSSISNDQELINNSLSKRSIIHYLGPSYLTTQKRYFEELSNVLSRYKSILVNNHLQLGLTDGTGALTVANIIMSKKLRITILTSANSWFKNYAFELVQLIKEMAHQVAVVYNYTDIKKGDICFILSYWDIVPEVFLTRNSSNLVVHESNLPKGKGWSPLTWQIIEGNNEIPVVIFEATDEVDAGPIYLKTSINYSGHEIVSELRKKQAEATLGLCLNFINNYYKLRGKAKKQTGEETYYRKRTPEDSRVDPDKTIREQFDLLRTVDNKNYPAFFECQGEEYYLHIYKKTKHSEAQNDQ